MTLRQRALPLLVTLSLAITALAGGPVVAAAPAAPAAGFVVNNLGDAPDADLGNPLCQTATPGQCTWRAALQQANNTPALDTITFGVSGTITLTSFTAAITHTLTVIGPGPGLLTIDANGTGPAMIISADDPAGPVNISGLTLTGGDSDGGGGVQAIGELPVIFTNVVITGNQAETGGGLFSASETTLIDTTVSHNLATFRGGGIDSHSKLELINSRVQENELLPTGSQAAQGVGGYSGGGLFVAGYLTMTSSLVLSNTAAAPVPPLTSAGVEPVAAVGPFGIGIYLYSSSAVISDSVIAGNRSLACITCTQTTAAEAHPAGVAPVLTGHGGGVYAADSGLTLENTQVLSNTAQQGGGIVLDGSQLAINRSSVSGNRAETAGGIFGNLAYLYADILTVFDNWANSGDGGGLYLYGGYISLDQAWIVANNAGGDGGGLYVSGNADVYLGFSQIERNASGHSQPLAGASFAEPQIVSDEGGGLALLVGAVQIYSSAIVSNTATLGGGITNAGHLYMENSTLSGNRANRDGGGLRLIAPPELVAGGPSEGSTAELNFVTLANNLADADNNGSGDGGGLFVTVATTVTLLNTLVALNADSGGQMPTCAGVAESVGYNLVDVTAGCTLTATTGDQFNVAAGLQPLNNYGGETLTHALTFTSLAKEAADPANCYPQDERNVLRPFGPNCDIGAFELSGLFIPLVLR